MAQPGSARWPPAAALALLWASLVLPSTAVMQSQFRTRETLAYALAVAVLLFLGHRALAAGAFGWVGDAQTRVLAAVNFAGLLAIFLWVYPMVNTSAPGVDHHEKARHFERARESGVVVACEFHGSAPGALPPARRGGQRGRQRRALTSSTDNRVCLSKWDRVDRLIGRWAGTVTFRVSPGVCFWR